MACARCPVSQPRQRIPLIPLPHHLGLLNSTAPTTGHHGPAYPSPRVQLIPPAMTSSHKARFAAGDKSRGSLLAMRTSTCDRAPVRPLIHRR